jgi:hypothetical protein
LPVGRLDITTEDGDSHGKHGKHGVKLALILGGIQIDQGRRIWMDAEGRIAGQSSLTT